MPIKLKNFGSMLGNSPKVIEQTSMCITANCLSNRRQEYWIFVKTLSADYLSRVEENFGFGDNRWLED
jgi:hypothetical protein